MKKNTSKRKETQNTKELLPIIGIGASAGGLNALKKFFSQVPEKSGLAYVVVVHLSPEHKSVLADLLQPHVKMPVRQVQENHHLQANHVYVIPPNANLNTIDTHLRLSKLEERRSERAPIDHFFRTLAQTHKDKAIGIILTGTGSDGTLGLKDIKEKGGLTIVQEPNEAEYDGMPQSAISTGLIDLVLPISEMYEYLVRYIRTSPQIRLIQEGEKPDQEEKALINRVFAQVKARTGRDFSRYKLSTIMRRLQRRMQIYQMEELEKYLEILRKNPEEVRALSDDFLINVTNFFRDPAVFDHIGNNIIPKILQNKNEEDEIRIWSVGCATGEEAYSIAVLFAESLDEMDNPPGIQIFASDLHENALKKARDGFFPGDISTDVSRERLKRHFSKEDGGYRIRKELRDQVVFTPHNLLNDPPFSRLDMVVCRNLLIYLKRDVQKDIFELFHYALLPNGYLVLGSSENMETDELFRTESKDLSIFQKKNVTGPEPKLPVFPKANKNFHQKTLKEPEHPPLSHGALHQRLVERFGPPGILLSNDYNVMHVSENAGRYLRIQGGDFSKDLFKLVRAELSPELRSSIHLAKEEKKTIRSKPIDLKLDGQPKRVVMSVRVIDETQNENMILVMFEEYELEEKPVTTNTKEKTDSLTIKRIEELEEELNEKRQQLQSIIEEYETSREEMKASNEELQSSNEELRSTMEELETSKEELQSVNEELTTLNQENRHKVEELAQMSDDLQNLLASTQIATLFLNREFRIMRYTPRLAELFSIRPADRGRPVSDINNKMNYSELTRDADKVIKHLQPVEREIEDDDGNTYMTRILPYRSTEDKIEGVVITFIDISGRKNAEEALERSKEYAESIVETLHEPILVLHPDLRVRSANAAFYEHFQVEKALTEGKMIYELGNGQWDIPALRKLLEDVLPENNIFNDFEVSHEFEDIGPRVMLVNARRLDHVQMILLGIRDITERKQAEEMIRSSEERLRLTLDATGIGCWVRNKGENVEYMDENNIRLLGLKGNKSEYSSDEIYKCIHPEDEDKVKTAVHKAWEENGEFNIEFRVGPEDDFCWLASRGRVIKTDNQPKMIGINYDITERKEHESELHEAREQAEKAARAKEEFLAHMSHEIRTPLNAIVGFSHLLIEQEHTDDQHRSLQILHNAAGNLNRLINDILDLSKIQAGKISAEPEPNNLREFVKDTVLVHRGMAQKKGISLNYKIDDRIPEMLYFDRPKLSHVVHNLLSNAVKFTEKGEVKLGLEIKQQEKNNIWIEFSVTDTGVGIAEDKLEEIFDVFRQADTSTVRKYGGTGLGLTIAKLYLEMMSSKILVESKKGKGSRFFFVLPVNLLNLKEEFPREAVAEKIDLDNNRILVVEDDTYNRVILEQLFDLWELHYESVTNGKEAVKAAESDHFNLILMDIRMPEMDGYEATRRIREIKQYKNVPIVVLTADVSQKVKDQVKQGLFTDIVMKPVQPDDLKDKLRELLADKQGN